MMVVPVAIGIGLAASVGLFAHGFRLDRDRAFYATVLIIVGSYYALFAVMAGARDELVSEVFFFAVFATFAVVGFRVSLWIVVAGLALHGVFDFFRGSLMPGRGVPVWWPAFCAAYDVVAGMVLGALLLAQRRRREQEDAA